MRLGFHASHEQIAPSRLLSDVQHAERAGFEMAMCSDHIAPWGTRQGHSGYAWSWLGAALATTGLPVIHHEHQKRPLGVREDHEPLDRVA